MAAITLDDITLSDEEQRCVLIVWQANAIGICPLFEGKFPELCPVAARLSQGERRLMYMTSEPEYSDMASGYCLTHLGDWIGEVLFDSGELDFGDGLEEAAP